MLSTTKKRTNTGDALASYAERMAAGSLLRWRCPICGRKMNMSNCKRTQLQIDHLDAHANGGSDEPGNLIPMCGQCNAAKNKHQLEEGVAAAILASTPVKTISGARRRAQRHGIVARLEWLAVAIGAILEDNRS